MKKYIAELVFCMSLLYGSILKADQQVTVTPTTLTPVYEVNTSDKLPMISYGFSEKYAKAVVELHITNKELPKEETKKKYAPRVENMSSQSLCSGVFVNGFGSILTAKHCVEGAERIEVQTSDGKSYKASSFVKSPTQDLALIHIDKINTPFLPLATKVTRGEQIFILGSPLGITDVLTTGLIAKDYGDILLVDCGVLPGNSGGPVLNAQGEIVGVATAGFVVLLGMTHLNIAQSLDSIAFFIYEVSMHMIK